MKKILIITLEFPPAIGGIATYIHDLARALAPASSIIVLAPPASGDKEQDALQAYRVIRKPFLYPAPLWPKWMRLFFAAWTIVRKEKIDLIMVHHVLPVGYAGILLKIILHVPFLLFSHGTDLVAGTRTPWKKKMIARVSRSAEQIIFNSQSLMKRFLNILPQFADTSVVLYPCPEEAFFVSPPREELDALRDRYALHGKRVILTVSRITDGKGFPHMIRMLPKILERDPNLVWLVVGDGDKRSVVMDDIQKNYLQNVVRYMGEMPHAALRPFYYIADLFLLLTHPDEGREEGLGLVFLEAAAAGLPVVAGHSGGVEEAVVHTETGIVVDVYQNEKAVIDAIVDLLHNPEKAKEMGRRGQERMRRDFRWEKELGKLSTWI